MKKIIIFAIAMLLILTLAVGCGNTDKDKEGEGLGALVVGGDSTSKGLDWPESSFPQGFPEYPGGSIDIAEMRDDGFYVEISETDSATYDAYKTTLASAGWVFQTYDYGMGADIAFKDGMLLILLFQDGTVGISLDHEGGKTYVDWPAEAFPEGFPVYPSGLFTGFVQDETKTVLYIERSTKDDFDSFVKALQAAGWNRNPYEGVTKDNEVFTYTANNNVHFAGVTWSAYSAHIYVYEQDYSGSDYERGNEWPANLGAGIRIYPDGSINYTMSRTTGNYRITVLDTSAQTFGSYLDALIQDGWESPMPLDYTGTNILFNDAFDIIVKMDDSRSVSISVQEANVSTGNTWDVGWPTSLPVTLPVYPDGDIQHMERSSKAGMSIQVEHTSQASYDSYIDSLLAGGWALSGSRDATNNTLTKGSSTIKLVLKINEGNNWISIDLTY